MIFKERQLSQEEVTCAQRTLGDQVALDALCSNCSYCFSLDSSSLRHISAMGILRPHKSEPMILQVSALHFCPSHSVENLKSQSCARNVASGPRYLQNPLSYCSFNFAHCLDTAITLPSSSGICSPVLSVFHLLSYALRWLPSSPLFLSPFKRYHHFK